MPLDVPAALGVRPSASGASCLAWPQDCAALSHCLADTFTREVAAVALSVVVAHQTCFESQRKVRAGLAGMEKTKENIKKDTPRRPQEAPRAPQMGPGQP